MHPYIPYYNRRLPCPVQRPAWRRYPGIGGGAAFDGMPSGATQAAYRRFMLLLYCVRWSGANHGKSLCKALCTVLGCGWYNLHEHQKGHCKCL